MITRLDHFVLICPDIEAGVAAYETVLGAPPVWRAADAEQGVATAVFNTGNTALELMAPSGTGPVVERLTEILDAGGPALTSLAYASDDLDGDHHGMSRRGLAPSEISDGGSVDSASGAQRSWRRFRCSDAVCAGVKSFVLQASEGALPESGVDVAGVHALDHLVINTPNPERAVALYGARLGLRLALDRTAEEWKTRFLFFRLGGLTLEVIHRLGTEHDESGNDALWGVTWAVGDLEATRERLAAAGLSVSGSRTGRKPGSRVFTLREGTLGIPTLFIAHEAR